MPDTPAQAAITRAATLGASYLAGLGRAHRKREGIWYTPPDLARALAEKAIALCTRPVRHVLDPACGAGVFLAAARAAGLARGVEPRVYGVDRDPGAIAIAAHACPEARLVGGDSLLDLDYDTEFPEVAACGGFDLVITNPPYVRADAGPLRARLRASGRFESLAEKWDLAAAFVERSLQLCRPGGLAVFLLSDSYGRAEYARKQQRWLEERHGVLAVEHFPGLKAFDAGVGSMAVFVERFGKESPAAWIRAPEAPPVDGAVRLADLCHISYGLRANSDERRWPGAFVTADVVRDVSDPEHARRYTEGKDLGGFRVLRTRYLEWGTARAPAHFARRSDDAFLEAAPKILALCICGEHVRAALDLEGHAFNHTVVGILPGKACGFDIRYLLAILHARQTREYLAGIRRSDKHIYPDDWREVLVPACTPTLQGRIGDAVDAARSLAYPSRDFELAMEALQELLDLAFCR